MKIRLELSAEELEIWLAFYQDDLKEAATNEPLVSCLYSTAEAKLAFVRSFLERHGLGHGEDLDSRRIIAEAAGRLYCTAR